MKTYKSLSISIVLFTAASVGFGAPELKELRPWGAQRGTAFILNLVGSNLPPDARILSNLPAAFTPLTPPGEAGNGMKKGQEIPFLVELKAEAPVGLYPIRLTSREGISNVLLFSVGVFPERVEQESELIVHKASNDAPEEAEPFEAPVTLNGTLAGPDRDLYRLQAKKGQRLVFEVEARRAGSAVDPVIAVLDAQQHPVATNQDAPGLGLDCRVDVSFPADGEYYVAIHDSRFSEQETNFYRLKIGSFTYADGIFPLGGRRGEQVRVQFLGGNLPKPAEVMIDLSRVDSHDEFTTVPIPGTPASLPFVFAVSDLPEIVEQENQETATLGPSTVINGRIAKPGEIDRYKLSVKPGEEWTIELRGIDLGTSRLFGVLTVYDSDGKRVVSAGDDIPDPGVFALIAVGRTSSDPFVQFKVPENVHEVTIAVEDLVQRGGPLFGYRLSATKQPADFTLSVSTPYVNISAGGAASIAVNVQRRGYLGPVQLTIPNAGDELIVEGGYVPPEIPEKDNRAVSRRGVLTITARENAAPKMIELEVVGEAVLDDGTVIRRRADGPGLITDVSGGTGLADPNRADRQKPFDATWLGMELPAMITKAVPVKLQLEGPRNIRVIQGMQYDLEWSFISEEKNFRSPRRLNTDAPGSRLIGFVPKDREEGPAKKGVMLMRVLFGARPQKFDLVLSGDVEINGKSETIVSPALTVEVVQGYAIALSATKIAAAPGKSMELVGNLKREPGFPNPVKIEARYLPRGVSCEPVEVAPDQQEFRLLFTADASVKPGEYDIQIDSSSTMVGAGMDKAVPYSIPPVAVRLSVEK